MIWSLNARYCERFGGLDLKTDSTTSGFIWPGSVASLSPIRPSHDTLLPSQEWVIGSSYLCLWSSQPKGSAVADPASPHSPMPDTGCSRTWVVGNVREHAKYISHTAYRPHTTFERDQLMSHSCAHCCGPSMYPAFLNQSMAIGATGFAIDERQLVGSARPIRPHHARSIRPHPHPYCTTCLWSELAAKEGL